MAKRDADKEARRLQALEKHRDAEAKVAREEEEREACGVNLGPKLDGWAKETGGKMKNIRVLLSSLHTIWPNDKWKEVSMGVLLNAAGVKKTYRKAILMCHPDRHKTASVEMRFTAERVFEACNAAWGDFEKTEM